MKKRLISLMTLLCCIMVSFCTATAFGASAELKVSSGGKYTKGSQVSITYTYTGTDFSMANTTVSYNSSVLQYESCIGGTAPESASGVLDIKAGDGSKRNSLTVTLNFKAIKAGKSDIVISTGASGVMDYDGSALNIPTKSISITVEDPSPELSSNADLALLKVSAGSLSPDFSPSVTSYTVNVSEGVQICTISASPQDSNAEVSIHGSKELSTGRNVRSVTVTAQNGVTKTYTVVINRGDKQDSESETENNTTSEVGDISVSIGNQEYVVKENYGDNDIPEGFLLSAAKYGDHEIPVVRDSKLRYAFALLKNQATGIEEWFFYDEGNNYFVNLSELEDDEAAAYAALLEENLQTEGSHGALLIILTAAMAAGIAAIIILRHKFTKKKTN